MEPSVEQLDKSGNLKRAQRVTVLSTGAWGVVLSRHLALGGHEVCAYDLPEVIETLSETRSHPKLDDFELPAEIKLTSDLEEAVRGHQPDCLVVTTPGQIMRKVAEKVHAILGEDVDAGPPWVLCNKSLEEETLLTMAGVVESIRGAAMRRRTAVLSGPSFAAEVAKFRPTTVAAASESPELGVYVQSLFMSEYFRVYTQSDVLGVELGGSLKNVMAIAAGACDGLGLGENARAALITRGLAEITRLGVAMGARAETFAGLAGMGDLVLTCSGAQSRNHQFGELMAKGYSVDDALEEVGMVVEGMRTVNSAMGLSERHSVEMPIASEIRKVISEGKSPRQAVSDLMGREAKPERVG